jgi:hypothetical protein
MRASLTALALSVLPMAAQAATLSAQDAMDIQQLYARSAAQADAGKWTRHMIMNILLTPEAGGAHGVSYALIVPDTHPQPQNLMRMQSAMYEDRLVKTAEGWRFATRHLWLDENPATPFQNRHCQAGMNNCLLKTPEKK